MRRSIRRGGCAFLAATPVAFWLSAWSVEEARFSPFTLEYQKRKSLVVFTGEMPLYRSDWQPAANDVLIYIVQNRFIEPVECDDPHWQLVHRFKQGRHGGWERPFRCLHPDLIAWSEAHPDVAPLFWRTGYALVRSNDDREVHAGYELLGRFWECCETPSDLRLLISLLEEVYRIDVMSIAPEALRTVTVVPSKSRMLAPSRTPKNAFEQFKKFETKNGPNAKPVEPPTAPKS